MDVLARPDARFLEDSLSSDDMVIPASNTSEEFAKLISSEIPIWTKVAQDNNIKAN